MVKKIIKFILIIFVLLLVVILGAFTYGYFFGPYQAYIDKSKKIAEKSENQIISEVSYDEENTLDLNNEDNYRQAAFGDLNKNTKLVFCGRVIQVVPDSKQVRLATSINENYYEPKYKYGFERIVLLSLYDNPRLLEGDTACVKGRFAGLIKYKAIMGQVIEIPEIMVDFYSANDEKNFLKKKNIESKTFGKENQDEPMTLVESSIEENVDNVELNKVNNPSENQPVPKFKDYPVEAIYTGKSAKLLLNNDTAKTFRTRLRESLEQEPVFAGEYVLAVWGCGAGCRSYTFANKRTGQVVESNFGGEDGDEPENFKLNSNLLVARGIEYDDDYNEIGYYASFYVLENEKFKLIKRVATEKPKSDDE